MSVGQRLSICVRYVKDGEAQTKLLCNVYLDGCAHTIVNSIAEQFENCGINLANWGHQTTDGTAVMVKGRNGVGVQLINNIHLTVYKLIVWHTD